MLIIQNDTMGLQKNNRLKWYVFTAVFIVSGFPMWLTDYTGYSDYASLFMFYSGIICAAGTGTLVYYSKHKTYKIVLFMAAAHQLAFIVKVFIDSIQDSTNHNMLPFEIIVLLGIDLIFSFIIAAIMKQILKKRSIK